MSEFTSTNERTPYNGLPYYCSVCGIGFREFIACEEVECKLEDDKTAQARMVEHQRKVEGGNKS